MRVGQWLGAASALLGIVGTLLLYFGSYSLEPYEGGIFGGPDWEERKKGLDVKNQWRIKIQRMGLFFLGTSFLASGVAAFL